MAAAEPLLSDDPSVSGEGGVEILCRFLHCHQGCLLHNYWSLGEIGGLAESLVLPPESLPHSLSLALRSWQTWSMKTLSLSTRLRMVGGL